MGLTDWKTGKKAMVEAMRNIPPGAVGISGGTSFVGKLIGYWWMLKNLRWAIKTGFKVSYQHAFWYWGGGKHDIIETTAFKIFGFLPWGRVERKQLYLGGKGYWGKLFYNKNTTVHQLQLMKSYAAGSIGRMYDVSAFLKFAFDPFPDSPNLSICTGITAEIVRAGDSPFMKNKTPDSIHPTEALLWLESKEARELGLEVCYEWKEDKFRYEKLNKEV